MDVDAGEHRPDGGGRGRNTPRRRDAGAAARRGARMRKPPELRIIQGSKRPDDSRLYRLPRGRAGESAVAAIEWPRAGAWRELIHRLLRNPIVTD
jgi:hypothetical protein